MSAAPLNAEVMSIAVAKLDVPADSPVLFVTRDIINGQPSKSIDLWVAKPETRRDRHGSDGVFVGNNLIYGFVACKGEDYLGAYTPEAVREALGFVPEAGDCICIDNPRVN